MNETPAKIILNIIIFNLIAPFPFSFHFLLMETYSQLSLTWRIVKRGQQQFSLAAGNITTFGCVTP